VKKSETKPESLTEISVEVLPELADRVEQLLINHEMPEWQLHETRRPDFQKAVFSLKGLFPDKPSARAAWKGLRSILPPRVSALKPDLRSVRHEDWANSYKQHFKAWSFAGLHWVPVWQKETFRVNGDPVLWLDPGMAFGTGNHETTRLCVEQLIVFAQDTGDFKARATRNVIDAGSGSGILALSARKLGFKKIFAFDNDPIAVDVSRENAELNECADIEFAEAHLDAGLKRRKADLVLANIQADILQQNAAALLAAVKPGGRLILSGILAQTDLAATRAAFDALKPKPRLKWTEHVQGEWACLVASLAK
jgi:ribosomal protein L11 methyltransferase